MAFRTRIVRIGNSRGVRIPKALLEESGLAEDVELESTDGVIVIRPVCDPREGWEQAVESVGPAELIIQDDIPNTFDSEEWTWE